MRNGGIIIAGLLFMFIALLHLARIFCPFQVTIGNWSVPEWMSYVIFFIAGILAAWQFRGGNKKAI